MIVNHPLKTFDLTSTSGQVVSVGNYNLENNKSIEAEVDITIIDTGNGAIGHGKYVFYAHRFGGAVAIKDSTYAIIPLETPGTLSGASIASVVSGIGTTIQFTGVVGRNIRVIVACQLTSIQD